MTPRIVTAQVERIIPLTDSILQLLLSPSEFINYHAGQYLQILLGGEALCYSIANAPLGSHKYELHIRHNSTNLINRQLLDEIKQRGSLTLQLPLGDCHIDKFPLQQSLIFIAAGTGFAPIKSMIEQLLVSGEKRPFELFWGARTASDLYMDDKVKQWAAHVGQFRYSSVVKDSRKKLVNCVLEHHKLDLKQWQFVIAGPLDMAYAIKDSLIAEGVSALQLYSDAF